MAGFSQKFEDGLMIVAEKVDDNKYLSSIKNAFTVFMPFVIVGSFGTLLNALIASDKTGLARWLPWLMNLKPAFSAMNFCTMTFMAVPIIFLIAMNLAKYNKIPEYISGVVAVAAYISVVPQMVTVGESSVSGLSSGALGAQGLFIGMIIAVLVTELFTMLIKIDAIKIKMPPAVPAGIATSFNVLVPILLTLVITSVAGILFKMATGSYVNEWIYKIVQAPLESVFQSPIGIIVVVIISQLFWFLGIHGGLVISPIRNPLIAAAIAANVSALGAGLTPSQPVTYGFWLNFVVTGGAGITLSLIFAIFLFSKRDDFKMIGKLSFLPGLCGISEPIVFGLPLVLNPTFAIPFILNSGIATGIAMFATKIGFLPCNTVDVPFGVPVILSAFISHGWQGVVIQVIILTVCIFTWAPFVLISNKQAEEKAVD
ncbi:PTS transporter subunit EIIC [Clostridium sp. E02]|uniref:PTS sugar transporter subunit IIC n=1 Tax=Clostridium sp. E02 TaxID=2487134 RepID=UPI000F52217E|nr:PTS transporter subunit EIIC [Clostridium sp. E02]